MSKKTRNIFIIAGALCLVIVITLCLPRDKDTEAEGFLPDMSEFDANGIAYADEELDAFFVLDGAKWEYESTGVGNQVRFVDPNYRCSIIFQSIEDSSVFLKDKREQKWKKIKETAGVVDYIEEDIIVGQYDGVAYNFTYDEGADDAIIITFIIWSTSSRVYSASFSRKDEKLSEAESAISSLTETFLTYKEYLKVKEASTN